MARHKNAAFAPLVAGALLLVGLAAIYGFARGWLPESASVHGKGIDRTIHYLMYTTGALYLAGHVALAYFVWKYSKDQPQPGAVVPHRTEFKVALVPVAMMMAISEVGVLVIALPVFGQVYGDAPKDAFEVEVVSKQFEWLIRYPGADGVFGKVDPALVHEARNPIGLDKKDPAAKDDIVKRGVLTLPVERASVVHLRSLDVIHSFTVPLFRVKQDALPGFTATTMFTPERVGTFELACAELCGLGHFRMQGKVEIKTASEMSQWLSEQEPWL
jgi:cytochrome c oxidase subunit 2